MTQVLGVQPLAPQGASSLERLPLCISSQLLRHLDAELASQSPALTSVTHMAGHMILLLQDEGHVRLLLRSRLQKTAKLLQGWCKIIVPGSPGKSRSPQ